MLGELDFENLDLENLDFSGLFGIPHDTIGPGANFALDPIVQTHPNDETYDSLQRSITDGIMSQVSMQE